MSDSSNTDHAAFTLDIHQKRQAALLYHWMSLEYLRGLKDRIDMLIKGADVTLDTAKRQGRDALIANERWGVRDTSANWSTHVYPALEDFRQATIRDIALRATESYEFTGANQCSRMISEFSSMWMTEDEEKAFRAQFEAVYDYASRIDDAAGIGGSRRLDDFIMVALWLKDRDKFERLPRFRVRTDVIGVTGKRPPRTGVYVPRDDPFGTLQFAWTGNESGELGEVATFNELGLRLLAEVGRESLWRDDTKLIPFAIDAIKRDPDIDVGMYKLPRIEEHPNLARYAMGFATFTFKPCKWYFVEKIEDEYEDDPVAETVPAQHGSLRCMAGEPCPREGIWLTPARAGSRRRFAHGEVMPEFNSSYGATIWQYDGPQ